MRRTAPNNAPFTENYPMRMSVFLGLSLLFHASLWLLWLYSGHKTETKKRNFQAAGGMERRMSVQLASFRGIQERPLEKQNRHASSRRDAGHQPGRFHSDLLQKEQQSIFRGIVYPREARRRGWQGLVSIEAIVLPDGTVEKARILKSSGYQILDRAALRGLLRHRFAQGEKSEQIHLDFRFRLR